MDPWSWQAAEWGAFGQVGALVVAVVAGALVWLQVRQGQQIREDQTRPYVIVDFEFRHGSFVAIAVQNIGSTPACDVRFRWDPQPVQRADSDPQEVAVFTDGVPMLAPGRRIPIPYGDGPKLFSDDATAPLQYRVLVSYTDLAGKKKYVDPPLVLDLRPYKHSIVERDDLHQIYKNLEGVKNIMASWTGDQRLKVNTLPQAKVDERNRRWYSARQDERWEQIKREPRVMPTVSSGEDRPA